MRSTKIDNGMTRGDTIKDNTTEWYTLVTALYNFFDNIMDVIIWYG